MYNNDLVQQIIVHRSTRYRFTILTAGTRRSKICSYLRPYPDLGSRAPLPEQHLYEHSKKFKYQAMAKYALSSKVEARGENMRAH